MLIELNAGAHCQTAALVTNYTRQVGGRNPTLASTYTSGRSTDRRFRVVPSSEAATGFHVSPRACVVDVRHRDLRTRGLQSSLEDARSVNRGRSLGDWEVHDFLGSLRDCPQSPGNNPLAEGSSERKAGPASAAADVSLKKVRMRVSMSFLAMRWVVTMISSTGTVGHRKKPRPHPWEDPKSGTPNSALRYSYDLDLWNLRWIYSLDICIYISVHMDPAVTVGVAMRAPLFWIRPGESGKRSRRAWSVTNLSVLSRRPAAASAWKVIATRFTSWRHPTSPCIKQTRFVKPDNSFNKATYVQSHNVCICIYVYTCVYDMYSLYGLLVRSLTMAHMSGSDNKTRLKGNVQQVCQGKPSCHKNPSLPPHTSSWLHGLLSCRVTFFHSFQQASHAWASFSQGRPQSSSCLLPRCSWPSSAKRPPRWTPRSAGDARLRHEASLAS